MATWIVIYQELETREMYGWFCKVGSLSLAAEKFWKAVIVPEGRAIKCIAEFQSNIAGFSTNGNQNRKESIQKWVLVCHFFTLRTSKRLKRVKKPNATSLMSASVSQKH